jgi:mannosyltransferase OCH1-like enzyme
LYQCYLKHSGKIIVGDAIPKYIFQTWQENKLTKGMQNAVDSLTRENPSWTYSLFSDLERRKFIDEYFRKDILDAYDNLIPGAYRADLWRYCVLYVLGGVYIKEVFISWCYAN